MPGEVAVEGLERDSRFLDELLDGEAFVAVLVEQPLRGVDDLLVEIDVVGARALRCRRGHRVTTCA